MTQGTEATGRQGSRSRGYANGRATREDILEAAFEVFGREGYRGGSLREIASRVGISHPGLLHHFGSKAELLTAVLARRDERDGADFDRDVAESGDLFGSLVRAVERNAQRPGIVSLFTTLAAEATDPDHPAHAYFVNRYRSLRARFADSMTAEVRSGVPPEIASWLLVAAMDGLQLQWLLEAGEPEQGAVMSDGLALLLGELGSGRDSSGAP